MQRALEACKAALDAADAQRTACARIRVAVSMRGEERNGEIAAERAKRAASNRRAAEARRRDARESAVRV